MDYRTLFWIKSTIDSQTFSWIGKNFNDNLTKTFWEVWNVPNRKRQEYFWNTFDVKHFKVHFVPEQWLKILKSRSFSYGTSSIWLFEKIFHGVVHMNWFWQPKHSKFTITFLGKRHFCKTLTSNFRYRMYLKFWRSSKLILNLFFHQNVSFYKDVIVVLHKEKDDSKDEGSKTIDLYSGTKTFTFQIWGICTFFFGKAKIQDPCTSWKRLVSTALNNCRFCILVLINRFLLEKWRGSQRSNILPDFDRRTIDDRLSPWRRRYFIKCSTLKCSRVPRCLNRCQFIKNCFEVENILKVTCLIFVTFWRFEITIHFSREGCTE